MVSGASAETAEVVNASGEPLTESWKALMDRSWSTTARLHSFDGKEVRPGTGADPDWADGDGWHGSLPGGTRSPELHCRSWQSSRPEDRGATGELDLRRLLYTYAQLGDKTLAVVCVKTAP